MTPRFDVIELDAFQGWAIQITWQDGREQQLVGVYTSEEAATEILPTVAKRFMADRGRLGDRF